MVGSHRLAELREHVTHALRLHRQDQDVAVLQNVDVGLEYGDAGLHLNCGASTFERVARDNGIILRNPRAEHSLDERCRHLASADKAPTFH